MVEVIVEYLPKTRPLLAVSLYLYLVISCPVDAVFTVSAPLELAVHAYRRRYVSVGQTGVAGAEDGI